MTGMIYSDYRGSFNGQCIFSSFETEESRWVFNVHLFIYLFTYLFFICSWLTANKITAYNKNSYVYIHVNWHQLPNAEKTKNCKLNINLKKHL